MTRERDRVPHISELKTAEMVDIPYKCTLWGDKIDLLKQVKFFTDQGERVTWHKGGCIDTNPTKQQWLFELDKVFNYSDRVKADDRLEDHIRIAKWHPWEIIKVFVYLRAFRYWLWATGRLH